MTSKREWKVIHGTGLWCVGGNGKNPWWDGRDDEIVPVIERFEILKKAGFQAWSGHIGYELEVDDKDSLKYVDKVFSKSNEMGLICTDIVGSAFRESWTENGTFTSLDKSIREKAKQRLFKAGEIAVRFNVPEVRIWLGNDGSDGYGNQSSFKTLFQIYEPLLEFHKKFPLLKLVIEAKPGEPKPSQVLSSTSQGTALCYFLNTITKSEMNEKGHFENAWALIGPESNHGLMIGENLEQEYALACLLGVMGVWHAGDGQFRIARDFDDPVGKWNPQIAFETIDTLATAYEQGLYNSNIIVHDINSNKVPLRYQHYFLNTSKNFVTAALEIRSKYPHFKTTRDEMIFSGNKVEADSIVQDIVAKTMQLASELNTKYFSMHY